MVAIYERFFRLPVGLRSLLYSGFHALASRRDPAQYLRFLNYGYASVAGEDLTLALDPLDERDRYGILMYWHMIAGAGLEGAEILDVGCGRGGPAQFLVRRLHPRRYVGVDLSAPAVRYCVRTWTDPALLFLRADAQDLAFGDCSFDAVLNVESCRNYPRPDLFLSGVRRILRPRGALYLADMETDAGIAALRAHAEHCGLIVERTADVTPNVLAALRLDESRRRGLVEREAPRAFKAFFADVAGLSGTPRHGKFLSGELKYWSCRLRKAA